MLKLGRHISVNDIQRHLSSHVGRIGSTHTTPQHMCYLLRLMREKTHSIDPLYFQSLIDTLVDMILGESITSFYMLDGSERAFIRLKTPVVFTAKGYCCSGNIQLEKDEQKSRQCVFSLSRLGKPGNLAGIELYTEGGALLYHIFKGVNDVFMPIPKLELKEHTWHSIGVSHFDKELTVRVDEFSYKVECAPVSSILAQNFDSATIGASIDPTTLRPQHHFLGEMSTLCFYRCVPLPAQRPTSASFKGGSFVETSSHSLLLPSDQMRRNDRIEAVPFLSVNPKVTPHSTRNCSSSMPSGPELAEKTHASWTTMITQD